MQPRGHVWLTSGGAPALEPSPLSGNPEGLSSNPEGLSSNPEDLRRGALFNDLPGELAARVSVWDGPRAVLVEAAASGERLVTTLEEQFKEGARLEEEIRKNLRGLGYGG